MGGFRFVAEREADQQWKERMDKNAQRWEREKTTIKEKRERFKEAVWKLRKGGRRYPDRKEAEKRLLSKARNSRSFAKDARAVSRKETRAAKRRQKWWKKNSGRPSMWNAPFAAQRPATKRTKGEEKTLKRLLSKSAASAAAEEPETDKSGKKPRQNLQKMTKKQREAWQRE